MCAKIKQSDSFWYRHPAVFPSMPNIQAGCCEAGLRACENEIAPSQANAQWQIAKSSK